MRLEELVLANSGEDEFEEIFKLLIAKVWDERNAKPGRFHMQKTADETFRSITTLLREAADAWPGVLDSSPLPLLTPQHLEVCVQAMAPHTIATSGLEVMDNFFEFLVSRTAKGSKGQYFTPRHVVDFCVRMMKPGASDVVLDPACGSGGFLIHTLEHLRRKGAVADEDTSQYCATNLWGFDIDARAVRVAKALMILAGGDGSNILRLNSLLKPHAGDLFNGPSLAIEDVVRSRRRNHKGFDLIMTNPPFAGEVRENELLSQYALSKRHDRIERDVLFLERCVDLLRPGGRLAIVLPHNKFAVDSFQYVRDWLLKKVQPLAVVGLGRHTFLPHTHQKASILFGLKNQPGERAHDARTIFFAISERDGKNSKGQPIVRDGAPEDGSAWDRWDHDFNDILQGFEDYEQTLAVR
ncbi:MAG: N-6 DNA methylase [Acidobacteriota bacterium]